jgi:hypothetical protein
MRQAVRLTCSLHLGIGVYKTLNLAGPKALLMQSEENAWLQSVCLLTDFSIQTDAQAPAGVARQPLGQSHGCKFFIVLEDGVGPEHLFPMKKTVCLLAVFKAIPGTSVDLLIAFHDLKARGTPAVSMDSMRTHQEAALLIHFAHYGS